MYGIQRRAFEEEGRRCGTREIPPLQEQVDTIADHVRTQIALVAKEDDAIVGCVRGLLGNRVCTIRALVVEPSKHGRGIGSALLKALEAELCNVDRLDLTTNTIMEGNVPFYERHGYRVTEYTAPIPGIMLAQMSKSTPNIPDLRPSGAGPLDHRRTVMRGECAAQLPRAFPGGLLRRLRPDDLAAFQAYRAIPELRRFQGWSPVSAAEARSFLAEMQDASLFTPGRWVQLGIAEPEGDQLIGDIGVFLAADGLSGEVGFTLCPAAQGRGIATAAVRQALDVLFGLTGAKQVLGITDSRNAASVRLLERVGFRHRESRSAVFRGETCTEEVYALLRNDG